MTTKKGFAGKLAKAVNHAEAIRVIDRALDLYAEKLKLDREKFAHQVAEAAKSDQRWAAQQEAMEAMKEAMKKANEGGGLLHGFGGEHICPPTN